jgi:hypothetical protein
MKKFVFGMLAVAGLLMGSCSADDVADAGMDNIQLDGGPGGGSGGITPPPPPGGGTNPPPPGGGG